MSHVYFKKWQCRMSLSLKIPPCPLLNFRNGNVPCHYLFEPHVAVTMAHVALLNLRKAISPCRFEGSRATGVSSEGRPETTESNHLSVVVRAAYFTPCLTLSHPSCMGSALEDAVTYGLTKGGSSGGESGGGGGGGVCCC